tara:strand:+ start:235 stop:1881 length:1647 start_codon:yes stop_codon:yes gene_type:complete
MQLHPSNINYKIIKDGVENFFIKNKRIIFSFLIVLIFISLYFLIDFSTQSLVAHDEGLYGRRARLIESSDNWFSPPFETPHHKTLGSYWLIALSLKLFGNNELAIRLPSILSSFLCLICSYLIALKITNKKTALISLFSLCSMPLWIQYSRYASPDFPFVFSILLAILFFLRSLESFGYTRRYFYIFFSGLFLSISFFIRSYMAFVPLIGLAPFFSYNLFKEEENFKIFFFSGILIGTIPTLLNLYFAFQIFGTTGITSLFDFAKKQVIGDFSINNLLLIPLKFLYLTFPIGILLIILFIFTKPNIKIDYPLLAYCFPLLSFVLLLCMSTSYPHYFIFLLPSLSIIFASYLTSNSFRYSFSSYTISLLLIITLVLISSLLLYSIANLKYLIIYFSHGNRLIMYITSSALLFSYFTSIIYLSDFKSLNFKIIKIFYNIVIFQYVSLSLLFNFGVIGNPNPKTKLFLKDDNVSSIIKSNTIYLLGIDSKMQTLLSFYLPSFKILENSKNVYNYKYLITSSSNLLDKSKIKRSFITVNKFDNYVLLKNIDN